MSDGKRTWETHRLTNPQIMREWVAFKERVMTAELERCPSPADRLLLADSYDRDADLFDTSRDPSIRGWGPTYRMFAARLRMAAELGEP